MITIADESYFRLRMKLRMNRQDALERVTPFLFVGNNRYETSGGAIGTRRRLDSGRLWVCTAPDHDRPSIVRLALTILRSGEADRELNAFEAGELLAEPGTVRVNVSIDGEVIIMNTPLHYRIRPQALSVIAPKRRLAGLRLTESALAV